MYKTSKMVAELGRPGKGVRPKGYVGGVQAVANSKEVQETVDVAEIEMAEAMEWYGQCNKEESGEAAGRVEEALANVQKAQEGADEEKRRKTEEMDKRNRGGRSEKAASEAEFTQERMTRI